MDLFISPLSLFILESKAFSEGNLVFFQLQGYGLGTEFLTGKSC